MLLPHPLSRRAALVGMLALPALGQAASVRKTTSLFGLRKLENGLHMLTGFGDDLAEPTEIELPGRGHGMASTSDHIAVVARRPGRWLLVGHRQTGTVLYTLKATRRRHFQGHITYSPDYRFLFATENDYEAGRGVIGVYDTRNRYQRVGEFDSGGVGPHELRYLPRLGTLVVANGGIRTHPDSGRAKLNLDGMSPNLCLLDAGTGALRRTFTLPSQLHQLSIRHIDESPHGIAVAMQYEGPRNHVVPLVGLANEHGLNLFPLGHRLSQRLRRYIGSVAIDQSGQFLCVTSPKGSVAVICDIPRRAVSAVHQVADVCAVTRGSGEGQFVLALQAGGIATIGSMGGEKQVWRQRHRGTWDNHFHAA